MNFAHIHLILNHVPLFTIPLALVFLIYSLKNNLQPLRRFSLIILLLTSVSILPVYFTGEPAEETIEDLPGVSKTLIEAHEEAAETSLVLTLIIGGAALFALVGPQKPNLQKYVSIIVIVGSVVAVGSLGYTANLGGKIRHPELQGKSSEAG